MQDDGSGTGSRQRLGFQQIGFCGQSRLDFVADTLPQHAVAAVLLNHLDLRRGRALRMVRAQESQPPGPQLLAPLLPGFQRTDGTLGVIDQQGRQGNGIRRYLRRRSLDLGQPCDTAFAAGWSPCGHLRQGTGCRRGGKKTSA
jgi:hypothetical protein